MWNYPSIQALGWIPYFKSFRKLPGGAYITFGNESPLKKAACDFLFFSGNIDIPLPEIIKTESALDNFLNTSKNYRAALALRDIRLEQEPNGGYKASCTILPKGKCIGYTPYRNIFSRSSNVYTFQKGVGGSGSEIEPSIRHDKDGVFISYHVYFRIGFWGNLMARILNGSFAPKAKMRVDYYLKKNGKFKILLSGSHIPNQNWCILNNKIFQYDMMNINDTHLNMFFNPPAGSTIAIGNFTTYEFEN